MISNATEMISCNSSYVLIGIPSCPRLRRGTTAVLLAARVSILCFKGYQVVHMLADWAELFVQHLKFCYINNTSCMLHIPYFGLQRELSQWGFPFRCMMDHCDICFRIVESIPSVLAVVDLVPAVLESLQ